MFRYNVCKRMQIILYGLNFILGRSHNIFSDDIDIYIRNLNMNQIARLASFLLISERLMWGGFLKYIASVLYFSHFSFSL